MTTIGTTDTAWGMSPNMTQSPSLDPHQRTLVLLILAITSIIALKSRETGNFIKNNLLYFELELKCDLCDVLPSPTN